MKKKMRSNKLTIYLIKKQGEQSPQDKDIVKEGHESHKVDVGNFYFIQRPSMSPKWVKSFFDGAIDYLKIKTESVSALFIVRIPGGYDGSDMHNERVFALTWGTGRFLLKDDVIEERFGLKVVLNTIESDSLRRISSINIAGNQKLTNEQLPKASEIDDFGIDVERVLVNSITGTSGDADFVKGKIDGGDALSIAPKKDIKGLVNFLTEVYNRHQRTDYQKNFAWIDHIQDVKDHKKIKQLNDALIEKIKAKDGCIWMAIPEIIDWTEIDEIKYPGSNEDDDINMAKIVNSFLNTAEFDFGKLKGINVLALDKEGYEKKRWPADKCLYGELELEGEAYCINSGKWYLVEHHYSNAVNSDYDASSISEKSFPTCPRKKTEGEYNASLVESFKESCILLDKKDVYHGGGRSSMEVCDVLFDDKELVHVKKYSGSATLSHLFNQGLVSASLLKSDSDFREKTNEKITKKAGGNGKFLFSADEKLRITFAIISESDESPPHIPFFSKVALRYVKKQLRSYGYEVTLKTIRKN